MDERAAFLAAIQADPTAALPRLQFADWLDEHGETDAAEWLRLDVEEGETWANGFGRYHRLRLRQLELIPSCRDVAIAVVPLQLDRILAGWVR